MLWATPSPPSLAALSPQFIFPAPPRVFILHPCFSPGRSGFLLLCTLPAATKGRRAVCLVSLLQGLSSWFGGAFAYPILTSLGFAAFFTRLEATRVPLIVFRMSVTEPLAALGAVHGRGKVARLVVT